MLRDDQTALLTGLPTQWRYALTGGNDDAKMCFEESWGARGGGRTLEDVIKLNTCPSSEERWKFKKMIGLGAITGPESGGLLVIDFDGTGSQAARAFKAHFRHYPSELPKTLCNMSGKQGRGKVFLKVPSEWWDQFKNKSASWRLNDKVVLEAIWMNGTGTGRQAVICGDHPQSSNQRPLFYRWMPKATPAVVSWAEAPEWLLLGICAKFEENLPSSVEDRTRAGETDGTPWERLRTHEKIQLAKDAIEYCPNRDGRGSGTYEKVRRILCGLTDEFGPELNYQILADTEWESRNEWASNESLEKTIESLNKSTVAEDQRAKIGSLFHFAKNNGFQWPTWALPPLEQSEMHIEGLKKLINKMNACANDETAMAAWTGKAKREYGINPDELYRLRLKHWLGELEDKGAQSLEDIARDARKDNVETDVIDGLISRRVHVLVGGSHSGKTTLGCFLANRVLTKSPVDIGKTRHSVAEPGRVLILTSDCSNVDMVRDLAMEGVEQTATFAANLRITSGAGFQDMIKIVQTLNDFKPDLVIMDCLTSMAVPGCKIGDPAYADPIRTFVRHNGVSWPKCAIIILHHTSRDEPLRFSGTEQIKAASEELLVYYDPALIGKKRADASISTTRHLLFEKSRGGYAGRKLCITRDAYTSTWQWVHPQDEELGPLELLTNKFRAIRNDQWLTPSDWQGLLDVSFNERSFTRYLERLTGSVLEKQLIRSKEKNNRLLPHYRPIEQVREAARSMEKSSGNGVNIV